MTPERLTPQLIGARLAYIVTSANPVKTMGISPLDGEPMFEVPHSDDDAVEQAFSTARAAQPAWAALGVKERSRIIRRFHDLVLDHREVLCDAVQWENGKCRDNANDEVLDISLTARYYSTIAARTLAPQRRRGAFPLVTKVRQHHHPHGVVGVISPWNYPLTLGISDSIPALLAGNAIVWKPDLQTMMSALLPLHLLYEAGVPRDVIQVVSGEGPVVGPMVTNRADFVMFTGSTRVGREVAAAAATRLVPASLELGGKNSCIVMPGADLERAVQVAVRGAFANAGQLCIGTERVVVHQSLVAEFVPKFVERVEQLRVGARIGFGTDMGPLISQNQLQRVEEQVNDAVAKGARVLTGGKRMPEHGPNCYAPTVLADVTPEMTLCRTETFGPVCSIYTWRTEEELLALVNDTGLGLSASIVSRHNREARVLAGKLRAGGVSINDPFSAAYASLDAPMGGMGDSGLGRRHGVEGLLKYTEPQTVASQHLIHLGPQLGMSDEQWANFAVKAMRVLKALRIR